MADGRMLKKGVCTSKKLAGRFSGDPEVIKGYVFPRIKSISADMIQDCLFDMQDRKLIKLYRAGDDDFLEFTKFSDHQQLRTDREAKSIIPSPKEGVEIKEENSQNSPIAPGGLPADSRITPAKVKLNQIKLNKANARAQYKAEPKAEIIDPKKELVIKKLQEAFLKFPDPRYQHQIKLFVESHIFKKNGDAIIHCLNQLINSKEPVNNPKGYLEKILRVENGNFNERESVQEHEEHKKSIPIEGIPGLGEVLKTMAK